MENYLLEISLNGAAELPRRRIILRFKQIEVNKRKKKKKMKL